MVDKEQKHPVAAQLVYSDGSVYAYAQASADLAKGDYVQVNANDRLVKFQGGLTFPWGIVVEEVKKEEWTFVMIRPSQRAQKAPAVG